MEGLDEIIRACSKNDARAQEKLFNGYSAKLFGICCRYVKDRDEARDVLQETFIKIFTHINSLKQVESAEGWMKRIAVNTALFHLKEKKKMKFERVEEMFIAESNTEEEAIDEKVDAGHIMECLAKLPDGYRTVFNLYHLEGMSHREIGEKLGIQEVSSRSQYFKARKLLIELINEKETVKRQWKAVSIMMSLLSVSWLMLKLSLA